MLPADYPFELRPRPRGRRLLQWPRIAAFAIALVVHLAVLLRLLAAPEPMQEPSRRSVAADESLQVFLLDPPTPVAPVEAPPPIVVVVARPPLAPRAASPVAAPPEPAPPPRPAAPIAADAPVSAAQLFGGIEGAAKDLTASDRPLPGAGMPSAIAQLPGSAEPIVDLPVRFKRRPTPKQVTLVLARIVLGTMAANSDDLEQVRTMRNPLQDLTDAHIKGMKDPECNDPQDPLRDPRCYPPPPR